MKIDQNTGIIVNGKNSFYIEGTGLEGGFYGPVKAKLVTGIMDGKFTMQGVEDFDRWKLFGTFEKVGVGINGFSGAILKVN